MAKFESKFVSTGSSRKLPVGSAEVATPTEAAPSAAAKQSPKRDLEAKLKAAFEQEGRDGLEHGQTKAAADYQERLAAEQSTLDRARQTIVEAETDRRAQFAEQLRQLQEHRQRMHRDAESLAIELAYRAITRLLIVRQEDRTLLSEVCSVAIQELGNSVIRVRIPQAASDLARGNLRSGIEVVVDASLQPEQCFIETQRGESEAGLATRLEGLKSALLAALHDGGSDA